MSKIAPNGGQGFELWSLVNKFTLAFAAKAVPGTPLLNDRASSLAAGSAARSSAKLRAVLYAGVPCALKLVAVALLAVTKLKD